MLTVDNPVACHLCGNACRPEPALTLRVARRADGFKAALYWRESARVDLCADCLARPVGELAALLPDSGWTGRRPPRLDPDADPDSLDALVLGERARSALRHAGVRTVTRLRALSEAFYDPPERHYMPAGIGTGTMAEIREALAEYDARRAPLPG
jgi:hypothetical protein